MRPMTRSRYDRKYIRAEDLAYELRYQYPFLVGALQRIKRIAKLEADYYALLEELEVARREMPKLPAFKPPLRTAAVLRKLTKARAAWGSAWEK